LLYIWFKWFKCEFVPPLIALVFALAEGSDGSIPLPGDHDGLVPRHDAQVFFQRRVIGREGERGDGERERGNDDDDDDDDDGLVTLDAGDDSGGEMLLLLDDDERTGRCTSNTPYTHTHSVRT
jgi:hypothetical protein